MKFIQFVIGLISIEVVFKSTMKTYLKHTGRVTNSLPTELPNAFPAVGQGSSACTKNMCMRWDTKMGNLLLICNVRNRKFNLQIVAPKTDLLAVCTLVGVCSANVNLTVNKLSNVEETIMVLTLNASEVYNGRWSCRHGSNRDESSVEVAINQDKPTENPPITTISKERCIQLSLFTTNAGLLSSFVLISLILCVVNIFCKPKDLTFTFSDILVPCLIVSVVLSSSTIILSIIILKPTELIWKDCDRKYGHLVWLGVAHVFVSIFVTRLIRPRVCRRSNQQRNNGREARVNREHRIDA